MDESKPHENIGPEEIAEANNPDVGEGTPESAPEHRPSLSVLERLRLRLWL
jgi:hypothetical protein